MRPKKSKPELRPSVPGKRCPNCGEERERPSPGDFGTYPGWEEWVDVPHENPFDCIRYLHASLGDAISRLQEVEEGLSEKLGRER